MKKRNLALPALVLAASLAFTNCEEAPVTVIDCPDPSHTQNGDGECETCLENPPLQQRCASFSTMCNPKIWERWEDVRAIAAVACLDNECTVEETSSHDWMAQDAFFKWIIDSWSERRGAFHTINGTVPNPSISLHDSASGRRFFPCFTADDLDNGEHAAKVFLNTRHNIQLEIE